jgi:hypothetical protein
MKCLFEKGLLPFRRQAMGSLFAAADFAPFGTIDPRGASRSLNRKPALRTRAHYTPVEIFSRNLSGGWNMPP